GPLPDSRCALTAPFHPCPHSTPPFGGLEHLAGHASGKRPLEPLAVSFCCTFRRLAPPRRYLAPCPVEPGLSSASTRDDATVRPTPPRALSHATRRRHEPPAPARLSCRRAPCAAHR